MIILVFIQLVVFCFLRQFQGFFTEFWVLRNLVCELLVQLGLVGKAFGFVGRQCRGEVFVRRVVESSGGRQFFFWFELEFGCVDLFKISIFWLICQWLFVWFVGLWVGWMIYQLFVEWNGWLVGWLVYGLIDQLDGWLVGLLVGLQLVGCLVI